jgi:protein-S-isoprenylcysteine O-methyltransferase Ste14
MGNVQQRKGLGVREVLRAVVILLLMNSAPFLAAGRLDWVAGWVLVAVTVVGSLASRILMARRHPDLVAERAQFSEQAGAKSWDKVLMPLAGLVGPVLTWVIAGLDVRWGWSGALWSGWFPIGVAVMVVAIAFVTWAMVTNRFFSSIVRIQRDRGHIVCDSGPYHWVRHPGYAGGALAALATPLALGSWWAFVPAVLTILLTAWRTALEDRMLQQELPGYAAYTQRTRYRLLPGVW